MPRGEGGGGGASRRGQQEWRNAGRGLQR